MAEQTPDRKIIRLGDNSLNQFLVVFNPPLPVELLPEFVDDDYPYHEKLPQFGDEARIKALVYRKSAFGRTAERREEDLIAYTIEHAHAIGYELVNATINKLRK